MLVKGSIGCLAVLMLAAMVWAGEPAVAGTAGTTTMPPVVRGNALLAAIHRADPAKALDFAREIESQIAAFLATERDTEAGGPRLRYRGPAGRSKLRDQDDILQRNRKDFDDNPALKRLYQHSPLASLRMLKRLREAAGRTKQ